MRWSASTAHSPCDMWLIAWSKRSNWMRSVVFLALPLGDVLDHHDPSAVGERDDSLIAKVRPRGIWRTSRNGSPRAIMLAALAV